MILVVACTPANRSTTREAETAAPTDYKSCVAGADSDEDDCKDDCVDSYPDDPNPDPVACPMWFKGTSALARTICLTQCEQARSNAIAACCQTATVDGKPIDRNGGTDEAKQCNAAVCSAPLLGDSVACYQIYGGYSGQDVFGDACAIDVFGFCDPAYNDISNVCQNPAPPCGTCNLNLPPEVPGLIKMLGDNSYQVRQAAQNKLTAILKDALANASDKQCAINSIRNLLGNADSSDPEVAQRLRQIWSNLIYATPHYPPSVVPRIDCTALDTTIVQ